MLDAETTAMVLRVNQLTLEAAEKTRRMLERKEPTIVLGCWRLTLVVEPVAVVMASR